MPGDLQEEFYLPVLAQLRAHKSAVEELGIETRPESVLPYPFIPTSLVFLLLSSHLAGSRVGSSAFPHCIEGHQGFSSLWPLLPAPTALQV